MSTLKVVEEILRECKTPMVVRAIVAAAGDRLPTRSRTPDTVVARDLAMDIKRHPDTTLFARVAPGQYTLREYASAFATAAASEAIVAAIVRPAPVASPLAASGLVASDLAVIGDLAPLASAAAAVQHANDTLPARPLPRPPSSPPVLTAAGTVSAVGLERREDVVSQ